MNTIRDVYCAFLKHKNIFEEVKAFVCVDEMPQLHWHDVVVAKNGCSEWNASWNKKRN